MQVQPYPVLSIRTDTRNPNHHLWNNNGTWYIAYTALTSPVTAERIRTSLRTRDLDRARQKRDRLLKEVNHG
jgi:hypothetical protein